jgi:malonate-semialdehyde dehydrogenase (acetylating)/methylmalonate-semialdehyde dehydrogenase
MPAPRNAQSPTVTNGLSTAAGSAVRTVQNYIGGRWVDSSAKEFGEVPNPATNELIARVPMGGTADVDQAVKAAAKAYETWRSTPPVERVKPLFALKYLLEKHVDDIARVVTREHGKTLDESRGSVRRAIDNVDLALGTPDRMMGTSLEDIAHNIDCHRWAGRVAKAVAALGGPLRAPTRPPRRAACPAPPLSARSAPARKPRRGS